ncbi:hypothetical protein VDGL01_08930 [Verticillium dahliae]
MLKGAPAAALFLLPPLCPGQPPAAFSVACTNGRKSGTPSGMRQALCTYQPPLVVPPPTPLVHGAWSPFIRASAMSDGALYLDCQITASPSGQMASAHPLLDSFPFSRRPAISASTLDPGSIKNIPPSRLNGQSTDQERRGWIVKVLASGGRRITCAKNTLPRPVRIGLPRPSRSSLQKNRSQNGRTLVPGLEVFVVVLTLPCEPVLTSCPGRPFAQPETPKFFSDLGRTPPEGKYKHVDGNIHRLETSLGATSS